MNKYNLYFTPKDLVDHNKIMVLAHQFAVELIQLGLIQSYELCRITNSGNFGGMPEYYMSVHFLSVHHMQDSFSKIRECHMNNFPHSELMNSVKEFKVCFSEDVNA